MAFTNIYQKIRKKNNLIKPGTTFPIADSGCDGNVTLETSLWGTFKEKMQWINSGEVWVWARKESKLRNNPVRRIPEKER